MKYSDFCFTHNPSTVGAHARAASKGGSVRKIDRKPKHGKTYALKRTTENKLLKMRKNDSQKGGAI